MSFEAKYPGFCDACESPIETGQIIASTREKSYVHVICPDVEPVDVMGICPKCFMTRAVNGSCGCGE